MKNPFKRDPLSAAKMQEHIDIMAHHLITAADIIDQIRAENMALRVRGERLAQAIETNDWGVDSAVRMSDSVASWREFEVAHNERA